MLPYDNLMIVFKRDISVVNIVDGLLILNQFLQLNFN